MTMTMLQLWQALAAVLISFAPFEISSLELQSIINVFLSIGSFTKNQFRDVPSAASLLDQQADFHFL